MDIISSNIVWSSFQKKKKHIYYILDTDSADYDKMKQYGKHVIPFMSFRHILYSLVANLYIASDSKKHLYIHGEQNQM